MEFNQGMTLSEYKDAMLQNARIEVCTACKYPDVDLVLSEQEEKFIADYRFEHTGEEFKPGDALGPDEQMAVINFRAKSFEQYIELDKSVQEATEQAKNIKGECYYMPWTRSVILIRKPTLDEYDNHVIDLNVIEDQAPKTNPRETAMLRHQTKHLFARKMVVYPQPQKINDLCQKKPDLMGQIYGTVLSLANDQMKFEVLKYKGL